VQHVVRAHGGSVRVEARDGGGAALVVELPTPEASPA
jgi:signal transduction histidine kinase